MASLMFDIETTPMQGNYIPRSKSLTPTLFIAIAVEGQEELEYLYEIKEIVKRKSSTPKMVLLNEFYKNPKEAVSLSHPKHRYDLIVQWREYYSAQMGITEDDEEWLICDRDNYSFKSEQYDTYVNLANENTHFHFIVSNPSFQLWLLLHFTSHIPDFRKVSKCKDRINFLEIELKRNIGIYAHGSLDWGKYAPHVRDAINNSRQYDKYTTEDLKDKTGTHFFKLLDFLEGQIGSNIF